MSIWEDQWEDYERDKNDFEAWLDSINESGDSARDEEYYNLEMERQERQVGKYSDSNWERYLEDKEENADYIEEEIMNQAKYPEWMVKGQHYIMTVSNN